MQNPLYGCSYGGLCLLLLKGKSWYGWKYISLDGPMKNLQKLLSKLQQDLFWSDFVHPEYQQILPLITSMAALVEMDYHWVKEEKYKHPEYPHEALQRVNENKDESIMDFQKSPEPRKVQPVVRAVPPIYVKHRVPIFISPSSTRGEKRKASGSSAHNSQPFSGVSLSHEPHHGSLTVRFSAWTESFSELSLFFQVQKRGMSEISETSRDTDSNRMVCFTITINVSLYWFVIIFLLV